MPRNQLEHWWPRVSASRAAGDSIQLTASATLLTYPIPQMKSIEIRVPIFDIDEAHKPIDSFRVLALLQVGLEEGGEKWAESTEQAFYDALKATPPG